MSAIYFKLDQSKILPSGNVLICHLLILSIWNLWQDKEIIGRKVERVFEQEKTTVG